MPSKKEILSPLDAIRIPPRIQIACNFPNLAGAGEPREFLSEGTEFATKVGLKVDLRRPALDGLIEEARRERMRKERMSEQRVGRADTGKEFWKLRAVTIEQLARDIIKPRPAYYDETFCLVEAVAQVIPVRSHKTGAIKRHATAYKGEVVASELRSVLRLTFSADPEDEAMHEDDEREILKEFDALVAGFVWRWCYIWENAGRFTTINLTGGEDERAESGCLLRYHPKPKRLRKVVEGGFGHRFFYWAEPTYF